MAATITSESWRWAQASGRWVCGVVPNWGARRDGGGCRALCLTSTHSAEWSSRNTSRLLFVDFTTCTTGRAVAVAHAVDAAVAAAACNQQGQGWLRSAEGKTWYGSCWWMPARGSSHRRTACFSVASSAVGIVAGLCARGASPPLLRRGTVAG